MATTGDAPPAARLRGRTLGDAAGALALSVLGLLAAVTGWLLDDNVVICIGVVVGLGSSAVSTMINRTLLRR